MKVFFEAWCRIEGWVEANDPHRAYHEFDKEVKVRLHPKLNETYDPRARPDTVMSGDFYINGQVSRIRCFDAVTFENLDCGEINTTPCPWCKSSEDK